MQITAYVRGVTRVDESTADITCAIGFVLSGTVHNTGDVTIAGIGNLLSSALCNEAIQSGVSDYVDTNFGTSTTFLNVTLFGGVVAV